MVLKARDDPELLDDQEPKGTGALREAGASALSKSDEYEEKHYVKAFALCADVAQHLDGVHPYTRTVASLRRYERVT